MSRLNWRYQLCFAGLLLMLLGAIGGAMLKKQPGLVLDGSWDEPLYMLLWRIAALLFGGGLLAVVTAFTGWLAAAIIERRWP